MHEEDEVIKEVRRIKEEIAVEYNYDVRVIMRAMHERQIKNGQEVVSLPPKHVKPGMRQPAASAGARN